MKIGSFRRFIPAPIKPALRWMAKQYRSKDARILDSARAQLYGGFSSIARARLEALAAGPDISDGHRISAALELARWHRFRGDAASALKQITAIQRPGPDHPVFPRYCHEELYCLLGAGDARSVIESGSALAKLGADADTKIIAAQIELAIAAAHLALGREEQALDWFSKGLVRDGLAPLRKADKTFPLSIANVTADAKARRHTDAGKLSVLVPAFNCAPFVVHTLRSILNQSYENLEIIIVDDASTDDSWDVICALAENEPRIIASRHETNRGAYISRNTALSRATGDFVTVHDSDDWSHPDKFAVQIAALLQSGNMANVTSGALVLPDMKTSYRHPSSLVRNTSSLMIRRQLLERLGGWDTVRISGDSELSCRITSATGREPDWVRPLSPLSLIRVTSQSLTADSATGKASLYYGARWEYRDAYLRWHERESRSPDPDYCISRTARPFPVPRIMAQTAEHPVYKIILVADFHARDKARDTQWLLVSMLSRTAPVAIIHWPRTESARQRFDPALRDVLSESMTPALVPGEKAECERVIVSDARCLRDLPDSFPSIGAQSGFIVCPEAGDPASTAVDREIATRNFLRVFGLAAQWVRRPCALEDIEIPASPESR